MSFDAQFSYIFKMLLLKLDRLHLSVRIFKVQDSKGLSPGRFLLRVNKSLHKMGINKQKQFIQYKINTPDQYVFP